MPSAERGGPHRIRYSSRLGPVDSSVRALAGRIKFTARRHKFNKDSLYSRMLRNACIRFHRTVEFEGFAGAAFEGGT